MLSCSQLLFLFLCVKVIKWQNGDLEKNLEWKRHHLSEKWWRMTFSEYDSYYNWHLTETYVSFCALFWNLKLFSWQQEPSIFFVSGSSNFIWCSIFRVVLCSVIKYGRTQCRSACTVYRLDRRTLVNIYQWYIWFLHGWSWHKLSVWHVTSAQMAHKPVSTSSANLATGAENLLS